MRTLFALRNKHVFCIKSSSLSNERPLSSIGPLLATLGISYHLGWPIDILSHLLNICLVNIFWFVIDIGWNFLFQFWYTPALFGRLLPGTVFSYKLRYIVSFELVEKTINPKTTIYRNYINVLLSAYIFPTLNIITHVNVKYIPFCRRITLGTHHLLSGGGGGGAGGQKKIEINSLSPQKSEKKVCWKCGQKKKVCCQNWWKIYWPEKPPNVNVHNRESIRQKKDISFLRRSIKKKIRTLIAKKKIVFLRR